MLFRIGLAIEKEGDMYYGFCPDLGGVYVDGNSEEAVEARLKDAVTQHLVILIKSNTPIPIGNVTQDSELETETI